MTLSASAANLQVGQTLQVTAAVRDASGNAMTGTTISWASSSAAIATVDGTGLVTGVAPGGATISATAGGVTGHLDLAVKPIPVARIDIAPPAPALRVGESVQLTATAKDAHGNTLADRTISWSSSDTHVATISATGLLAGAAAGTSTVTAAAEGITATVTATVTQPVSILVLDPAAVAFTAWGATPPSAQSVAVRNAGDLALTGVTVGTIVYDAGQTSGWLTAAITGSAAPFTLTVTPSITGLAYGTYHALVPVTAPGASNSPVKLSVTLTVNPIATIVYGAATEKTQIVNVGASTSPQTSASDATGPVTPTFTSRAPSIATVDATGKITARAEGETWIAATYGPAGDSVYIIVPHDATGPLARTDLTTYVAHAGDSTTFIVVLDARTSTIGAATVAVGLTTETGLLSTYTYSVAPGAPNSTVINSPLNGIVKASIVSTAGYTGPIPLLKFTVRTPTSGRSGWVDVTVIEITDVGGNSLMPVTTSTRYPIIVQ